MLLADLTSNGVILESSENNGIPSSDTESAIDSVSSVGKLSMILILLSI